LGWISIEAAALFVSTWLDLKAKEGSVARRKNAGPSTALRFAQDDTSKDMQRDRAEIGRGINLKRGTGRSLCGDDHSIYVLVSVLEVLFPCDFIR
jgi:hypothetical protein